MIQYNKLFISIFIIWEFSCSTVQRQDETRKEIFQPGVKSNETIEKYFAREAVEDEAFRVYISSDNYILKQTGYDGLMSMPMEITEKSPMTEDVKAYDLVEVFTEAVYKVELFKDSGLISHIRPVKPSHISEINKIIADDISRFKFIFKDNDKIEPLNFKIRYGVHLQKKKSKDEIKKILQENVRQ